MATVLAMAPESFEGRERIARLESQVDSNRRQIDTLAPLVLQVGLVQRSQDDLREDLRDLRKDMEVGFDRQERSIGNQFAACSQEIARVAAALETKEAQQATNQTSRRAMWGLIGAAALTGILGLITQLITAFS
jgi:chromosome segregation ATPase